MCCRNFKACLIVLCTILFILPNFALASDEFCERLIYHTDAYCKKAASTIIDPRCLLSHDLNNTPRVQSLRCKYQLRELQASLSYCARGLTAITNQCESRKHLCHACHLARELSELACSIGSASICGAITAVNFKCISLTLSGDLACPSPCSGPLCLDPNK
jgi:hypothetical protein